MRKVGYVPSSRYAFENLEDNMSPSSPTDLSGIYSYEQSNDVESKVRPYRAAHG